MGRMRSKKPPEMGGFLLQLEGVFQVFSKYTFNMSEELEKKSSGALTQRTGIERTKVILKVSDNRNGQFPSEFDLEQFLKDLNVLMDPDLMYKAGITKYGKYFSIATAEGDHFSDSLRQAKAIHISVETRNLPLQVGGRTRTRVTIDAFVAKGQVQRTGLTFDEDGTYLSGSITRDLSDKQFQELYGSNTALQLPDNTTESE